MTAPIDIECPKCKAGAGRFCTVNGEIPLGYHHAERVDQAFRASEQQRPPAVAVDELLELGAWRAMARQTGPVDEVRSCRRNQPEDVASLIGTLRKWLDERQRDRDKLLAALAEALAGWRASLVLVLEASGASTREAERDLAEVLPEPVARIAELLKLLDPK